jgi:hypothetical protein
VRRCGGFRGAAASRVRRCEGAGMHEGAAVRRCGGAGCRGCTAGQWTRSLDPRSPSPLLPHAPPERAAGS